eukprot:CAMPEP_0170589770 /NCGR_PEP_ID=MMETSP0224-20130122/11518_1 /TAXON_ID=285029 /ORGANISM="Togula jolla, Strain CCCM 725" /LENGTH=100 /DNA_ID=CAMNT_0010913531 /DNA_START=40 /DNA_END=339 /DNA_ORIENTATION=-
MAALKLGTGAALFVGCSAFVPSTNLRSELSASSSAVAAQLQPTSSANLQSSGASTTIAGLGVTAGALALIASKRGQRRTVERSVVGICAPLTEKFDPLNL